MEFMNVIKNRQSCRAFTDKMVTESELEKILQAGNAAPVGNGIYKDVQLTVIQNKELCKEMKVQDGFVPCVMVGIGTPQGNLEERELTTERIHTEYVQ